MLKEKVSSMEGGYLLPRPRKPEEEKSSNLIIRLPNPVIWELEKETPEGMTLENYISQILSNHVKK